MLSDIATVCVLVPSICLVLRASHYLSGPDRLCWKILAVLGGFALGHAACLYGRAYAVVTFHFGRACFLGRVNQLTGSELPTHASRELPQPAPDQLHLSVFFDVSVAPLRLRGRVPDAYWSLTMFDWSSERFFLLNGSSRAPREVFILYLLGPQHSPGEFSLEPGALIVQAPTTMGCILNRIYLADAAAAPRYEQWYSSYFSLQELGSRGQAYSWLATFLPGGRASQHMAEALSVASCSDVGLCTFSCLALLASGYRSEHFRHLTPRQPLEAFVTVVSSVLYGLLLTEGLFFRWLAPAAVQRIAPRAGDGPWRAAQLDAADRGAHERAALGLGGLFDLPIEETLHLTASTDDEGERLRANREYRLSLLRASPAQDPALDASSALGPPGPWWSLAAYGADGHLLENGLGKSWAGSAEVLGREVNGSWSIFLTSRSPSEVGCAPAAILPLGKPTSKGIVLSLRFYQLGPAALTRDAVARARLPAITRVRGSRGELC